MLPAQMPVGSILYLSAHARRPTCGFAVFEMSQTRKISGKAPLASASRAYGEPANSAPPVATEALPPPPAEASPPTVAADRSAEPSVVTPSPAEKTKRRLEFEKGAEPLGGAVKRLHGMAHKGDKGA